MNKILNIKHMIKESFLKGAGYEQIIVVIGMNGREIKDNKNHILFMYCNSGNSDDNSVQIASDNPSILDVAEMVGLLLVDSGLRFEHVQMMNMNGSKVDLDNPKTDLKFIIDM